MESEGNKIVLNGVVYHLLTETEYNDYQKLVKQRALKRALDKEAQARYRERNKPQIAAYMKEYNRMKAGCESEEA